MLASAAIVISAGINQHHHECSIRRQKGGRADIELIIDFLVLLGSPITTKNPKFIFCIGNM
jgi:hypothetical protein